MTNTNNVHAYANVAFLPGESTLNDAEAVYKMMFEQGMELCKRAEAYMASVQMIVKMLRSEAQSCDESPEKYKDMPAMSIAWKVMLTDEENSRLSLEDIKELCLEGICERETEA